MADNNTRERFLDIVLKKFIPNRSNFINDHMSNTLEAFKKIKQSSTNPIIEQSQTLSQNLQQTLLLRGLCALRKQCSYQFKNYGQTVTIPLSFEDVVNALNLSSANTDRRTVERELLAICSDVQLNCFLNTTRPEQKQLLHLILYLCEWQDKEKDKWIGEYTNTFADISRDSDRFPPILLNNSTNLSPQRHAQIHVVLAFFYSLCFTTLNVLYMILWATTRMWECGRYNNSQALSSDFRVHERQQWLCKYAQSNRAFLRMACLQNDKCMQYLQSSSESDSTEWMSSVFDTFLRFMTIYPALNNFPCCCSPANCIPTAFVRQFVGDEARPVLHATFTQADALLHCFQHARMSDEEKKEFENSVGIGLHQWISAYMHFGSLMHLLPLASSDKNFVFVDEHVTPFLFDILLPQTLVLFCPPSSCAPAFAREWTAQNSSKNALVNALPRIDDICSYDKVTRENAKLLLDKFILLNMEAIPNMNVDTPLVLDTQVCALRFRLLSTALSTTMLLLSMIVLWLWYRRNMSRKMQWWTLVLALVAITLPTVLVDAAIGALLASVRSRDATEEPWRAVLLLWHSRCTTWRAIHDVIALLYATILVILARWTTDARVKIVCIGLAVAAGLIHVTNLFQMK